LAALGDFEHAKRTIRQTSLLGLPGARPREDATMSARKGTIAVFVIMSLRGLMPGPESRGLPQSCSAASVKRAIMPGADRKAPRVVR
jgi:hypothetical protein